MRRVLLFALSLSLGIGAFALVLHFSDSDLDDVWHGVALAGWPALGATIGLTATQIAVQAWSWRFLALSSGEKVSFARFLEATTVGWGMNFLTPSMYLGGEPVRALYVAHHARVTRREALATVIVHKYLEFSTFLFFLLVSTAVLVVTHAGDLSGWLLATVIAADLVLTVLCGILYLSVIQQWGLIVRLFGLAARLGLARRWLEANRQKIVDLEDYVHRAFSLHRRSTLKSLASMLLFTLTIYLRPVPFFLFLEGGWPFTLAELAVFFCLVQLLQAFQFTPGGLGLLEGGLPGIFLLIGVTAPEGLAYVAFQRTAELAFVAAGLSLFAHHGLRRLDEAS